MKQKYSNSAYNIAIHRHYYKSYLTKYRDLYKKKSTSQSLSTVLTTRRHSQVVSETIAAITTSTGNTQDILSQLTVFRARNFTGAIIYTLPAYLSPPSEPNHFMPWSCGIGTDTYSISMNLALDIEYLRLRVQLLCRDPATRRIH